jgi:hypothetical protein
VTFKENMKQYDVDIWQNDYLIMSQKGRIRLPVFDSLIYIYIQLYFDLHVSPVEQYTMKTKCLFCLFDGA